VTSLPSYSETRPNLDEIRALSRLAQLRLSDDELEDAARQLGRILDYVAVLQEVDITQSQGMTHAIALACPTREDRPAASLPAGEAVRGAPAIEGTLFAVPKVVG